MNKSRKKVVILNSLTSGFTLWIKKSFAPSNANAFILCILLASTSFSVIAYEKCVNSVSKV